jgi:NAD(P)-dependent dehydrogenase (short-subunit alcohol dehydrogenase family)
MIAPAAPRSTEENPLLSLRGKVALVTGSGSIGPGWGNGKATATLFARQGATVIGVDLNQDAAAETQRTIESEGGLSIALAGDVTDADQVRALVADCASRFGRIDVLVNNVGRSEPGGPVELDEQTWDEQMEVNVKSAFLTCKAVLPIMERQGGGAVVNVASVAGLRYVGKPQVAYSAGKAALMQFTRTTAVIYASRGIRLNCVVPGLMHTPLVRRLADKYAGGDYDGFVAHRGEQVPMGRMGDAWDVAHAALFLASDEARYVTATELVVDGGFIAATK